MNFNNGFNGFNFGKECNRHCENCDCGRHQQVDYMQTDIQFVDYDELVAEYVQVLKRADSEEYLYNVLYSFFNEVQDNVSKGLLFDQAKRCMEMINLIQAEEQE